MTGESYLAGPPQGWNYVDKPEGGQKLTLLTKGKIQVTGHWVDDGSFIAWAPLLKRDKELEKELGL